MDTQPLGPNALPARAGIAASHAPGPAIASDYQTFLNMLTVQIRQQDPLNPMDASDFAVQLATFSGVEQQVRTNQLLDALIGRSVLADMGSWVGMEVGVPGEAWFDGSPVTLAPEIPAHADSATLVVRDSEGNIIERRDLPTDTRELGWDGKDSKGEPLPQGRYSFVLETRSGDTTSDPVPVTAFQRVDEARLQDGRILLVLPGGQMMPADNATGLRVPQQPPDTA